PPPPQRVDLLVSAAASVKDALGEINDLYHKQHPGVFVSLNLGGSGTLETQIEQGAPSDVFVSAAPDEMNALQSKGLLRPGTRIALLTNRLVLIVPKGNRGISGIRSFQDLLRADVRTVALGNPRSVPAGMYAQQTLTKLGIYDAVRHKAVLASDVRQVLAYVETGSADAGIVYATDAAISSRVRIAAEAPPDAAPHIVYPAAALKSSAHPSDAESYLRFLQSDAARAVFLRYGFRMAVP
ncbi:MAG: molybdate ABC transporter substrate-binding protein, partial [Candidatus Acidiferrales bacterium]